MARHKLVPEILLKELAVKHVIGVPVARLIKEHDLDVSQPHLAKLIYQYQLLTTGGYADDLIPFVRASLFPEWLDNSILNFQEVPASMRYQNKFPTGEWVLR